MLLFGSEILLDIGATHIEAFGDSLLVVQQISMDFMYFDKSLNIHLDKCPDIMFILDCFSIAHIFIHDIDGQINRRNRHLAIMLIMVYCSRANAEFATIGETQPEPTVLATNGNFHMQAKARIGGPSQWDWPGAPDRPRPGAFRRARSHP